MRSWSIAHGMVALAALGLAACVSERTAGQAASQQGANPTVATVGALPTEGVDGLNVKGFDLVRADGGVSIDQVLQQDDGGMRLVRTTEVFKRVFLPENPNNYSDTTITALKAQENGDQLIEQMKIAYDLRVANEQQEMSAGERVFQTMLLQQIVNQILPLRLKIHAKRIGIVTNVDTNYRIFRNNLT